MKIKIYHGLLLAGLFASLGLTITLLILGFINLLNNPSDMMNNIIYTICFFLLIAFIILEIVNTFLSFKTGSVFIYRLAFDDNETINRNFLYIISFIGLLSLFGAIYMTLTLFIPSLPLAGSSLLIVYLSISFLFFFFVDVLFLVLFVFLGKEDKAFTNK